MSPAVTLKDISRESSLFRRRVVVAHLLVAGSFLVLFLRLIELQVFEYRYFQTLSHANRVKIVPIPPTRGLIFDRNGVVLAQNTPTFSLEVVPEDVPDLERTLTELKKILDIDAEDELRFRRSLATKRRFETVLLLSRLTEEQVARFSVNRYRFPGVDVDAHLSRDYPLGSLGVHVIGYVGRISEEDLLDVDQANYRATAHIGKSGVEQAYETDLHGRVGYQHVETNAQGRALRVLHREDPVPGRNLRLSIDASLQAAAEAAFDGASGALVAIEPATGDILAFVSLPGYDPNQFVEGIAPESYRTLLRSPDRPLFNRALAGQYPPGSTIKPFLGLEGLEQDIEQASKTVWCPGWYSLRGSSHRYRDWKKHGHGRVDLTRAIVESCDVYFYELASNLGIDRMSQFLTELGFGRPTGIDLRGEAEGLMPSSEWKRRARNQPWYPGETLITGIGQGFILSTPLQLAFSTATLGMRGLQLTPSVGRVLEDQAQNQMVRRTEAKEAHVVKASPEHWEKVIDAMVAVVHSPRGTANRVGVGSTYRFAGKTGTAQLFTVGQDEKYEADDLDKKLRDHGLFIAFAPPDHPKIALAVVVENAGGGSRTAAPIARIVMDHYLGRGLEEEKGLLLTSAALPSPVAPLVNSRP